MRSPTRSPTKNLILSIKDKLKKDTIKDSRLSSFLPSLINNKSKLVNKSNNLMSRKISFNNTFNNKNHEESFDKVLEDKVTLKDMIENASIENKVINLLVETEEILNARDNNINKENKEKYELIETSILERIKKSNELMKIEKSKLTEINNDLNKRFNKTNGELNYLNLTYKTQEKNKDKVVNDIYKLEESLKTIKINNQKIGNMLNKERQEKDNIGRSLHTFKTKYNYKLPNQLKELINEFESKEIIYSQQDKINELQDKIEKAEKILKSKKEETDKLKLLLKK